MTKPTGLLRLAQLEQVSEYILHSTYIIHTTTSEFKDGQTQFANATFVCQIFSVELLLDINFVTSTKSLKS